MALKIAGHVLAGMIEHARDSLPLECCGLLVGKDDVIEEHVRTRNVRESQVAYEIDPREHFAAMKSVRTRGRSVLGAYHSHPRTAATPSATDLAEAHYEGDFLYVIVSMEREPPDVRAYRRAGGELVAVSFESM